MHQIFITINIDSWLFCIRNAIYITKNVHLLIKRCKSNVRFENHTGPPWVLIKILIFKFLLIKWLNKIGTSLLTWYNYYYNCLIHTINSSHDQTHFAPYYCHGLVLNIFVHVSCHFIVNELDVIRCGYRSLSWAYSVVRSEAIIVQDRKCSSLVTLREIRRIEKFF